MHPLEACILLVNDALWCHPNEVANYSHGPFPGLSPTAESLAIFKNHLKTHFFFASTWPTNTNTYLFYLFIKNKNKKLATVRPVSPCLVSPFLLCPYMVLPVLVLSSLVQGMHDIWQPYRYRPINGHFSVIGYRPDKKICPISLIR